MNPNTPQPQFELPMPLPPQGENGKAKHEAAPTVSAEAQTASQQTAQPFTPPPSMPTVSPVDPSATSVSSASQSSTPVAADDADLIEKEWVQKAKQIVAATREDPFQQNKQMSKIKADYLKKRYNKDIKVEES